MNVKGYIRESIQEDRIVRVQPGKAELEAIHEALLAECEDSADTEHSVEYWGRDAGSEWRVHVARNPQGW